MDEHETLTGLNFLSLLDDDIEAVVESTTRDEWFARRQSDRTPVALWLRPSRELDDLETGTAIGQVGVGT